MICADDQISCLHDSLERTQSCLLQLRGIVYLWNYNLPSYSFVILKNNVWHVIFSLEGGKNVKRQFSLCFIFYIVFLLQGFVSALTNGFGDERTGQRLIHLADCSWFFTLNLVKEILQTEHLTAGNHTVSFIWCPFSFCHSLLLVADMYNIKC